MKVYIVIKASLDEDPEIIGVYLRMSKAEQHVKNLGCEYYIEEYKVTI